MSGLFESTMNTRQIVKNSYRFIRSDVPDKLTPEETEFLKNNNITTIIDLRTEEEVIKRPCPLEYVKDFTYIHLPVTGGNAVPLSVDAVSSSYIAMVDLQMKKIIDIIENAKTNVLYFCNAGKDRTGVVTAILLKKMGVSDDDIIEDYLESAENLKEMLSDFVKSNPDIDIDVITPQRRYMKEFLDYFRHHEYNDKNRL